MNIVAFVVLVASCVAAALPMPVAGRAGIAAAAFIAAGIALTASAWAASAALLFFAAGLIATGRRIGAALAAVFAASTLSGSGSVIGAPDMTSVLAALAVAVAGAGFGAACTVASRTRSSSALLLGLLAGVLAAGSSLQGFVPALSVDLQLDGELVRAITGFTAGSDVISLARAARVELPMGSVLALGTLVAILLGLPLTIGRQRAASVVGGVAALVFSLVFVLAHIGVIELVSVEQMSAVGQAAQPVGLGRPSMTVLSQTLDGVGVAGITGWLLPPLLALVLAVGALWPVGSSTLLESADARATIWMGAGLFAAAGLLDFAVGLRIQHATWSDVSPLAGATALAAITAGLGLAGLFRGRSGVVLWLFVTGAVIASMLFSLGGAS